MMGRSFARSTKRLCRARPLQITIVDVGAPKPDRGGTCGQWEVVWVISRRRLESAAPINPPWLCRITASQKVGAMAKKV
jgi:hypothetical protein